MRLSRPFMILAFGLLPLTAIAPVSGADTSADSQPAGRVTGLIRPGRPRLDPTSPWLMSAGWPSDGSYQLIDQGRTLGPLWDGLSPWLLGDQAVLDAQRLRGARYAGTVEWSDPRFIGWLSMVWNRDLYRTAGPSASVDAVSVRLDGDGGSWVGSLTGTGDPGTGSFRIYGTLEGIGAFHGLTTVLAIVGSDPDLGWSIDGLVVSGLLPPVG